jgi:hypothetical protein
MPSPARSHQKSRSHAAFMLVQAHGWDIHAVTTGRRARDASHGSAPGALGHHGPQPGWRQPLTIDSSQAFYVQERGIHAE